MSHISIKTLSKRQVIDITEHINEILSKEEASSGVCVVFVLHTTAAITTADLDPGTDLDMLDAIEAMTPKIDFRHPHDPSHTPDHIWSSIIGPSVTVPVENGELVLGTWQRAVLLEFDGPRVRKIVVKFIDGFIDHRR